MDRIRLLNSLLPIVPKNLCDFFKNKSLRTIYGEIASGAVKIAIKWLERDAHFGQVDYNSLYAK
jgi:hypothetical protein